MRDTCRLKVGGEIRTDQDQEAAKRRDEGQSRRRRAAWEGGEGGDSSKQSGEKGKWRATYRNVLGKSIIVFIAWGQSSGSQIASVRPKSGD